MSTDIERAAFEAWAKDNNYNTNWHSVAKFFTSTDTQVRWEVWQAARAAPQAPTCPHRVVDARNPYVESGYLCMDCGAVFAAADHFTPPAPTPAAAEGQADLTDDQCTELAEELQREWMRKAIAETRTAASLFDVGGFRAGMETACDEIETRMALDAAPLPRQAAVQLEDAARLDWLEQRGNDGGLLLHAGNQDTGGRSGLGLINTGRTLRQAVDSARGVKDVKSAPATTEKEKS
jgi:hypothetical protein